MPKPTKTYIIDGTKLVLRDEKPYFDPNRRFLDVVSFDAPDHGVRVRFGIAAPWNATTSTNGNIDRTPFGAAEPDLRGGYSEEAGVQIPTTYPIDLVPHHEHLARIAAAFVSIPGNEPEPREEAYPIWETDCVRVLITIGEDQEEPLELALHRDGRVGMREWKPYHRAEPVTGVWAVARRWVDHGIIGEDDDFGRIFKARDALPKDVAPADREEEDLHAEAVLEDDLRETAERLFWRFGNARLSDPYLKEDDEEEWLKEAEEEWEGGDADRLAELIRMFVVTDPELLKRTDWPLRFDLESETDEHPCRIYDSRWLNQRPTERLQRLTAIAAREIRFRGWSVEYNDGAGNRRSGFSHYAHQVEIEVHKPSGHDALEAIEALREWLSTRVSEEERADLLKDA